ncbi:MAG: GGDEF domain-containing protein [Magnetococcales bacterium]|nr:GGDEF domain-containing protein [Magnetococcales bacterium]
MKQKMLKRVMLEAPLFKGAPTQLLNTFLEKCPIHKLQKQQVLIAPGEHNEYIYIVISGSLTVHLDKPENPSIRTVNCGGTVGELSLIGSTRTSAYVISQGISSILMIDRQSFWSIIDAIPVIAKNMLKILSTWIVEAGKTTLDNQKQIAELEGIARVDGLTGINNRRYFDELIVRFAKRSDHGKEPMVLIMIDVDHFKNYNDTHGHLGGDQALVALAKTLHNTVRPGDFVFRYGGEEFAIILPITNRQQCNSVAERVRVAVMNTKIAMPDGTPLPSITISMGIAEYKISEETESELLKRADAKLYEAKESGRNRFCI